MSGLGFPRRFLTTTALAGAAGLSLAGCGAEEADVDLAPRTENVSREIVPSREDRGITGASQESSADILLPSKATSLASLPSLESAGPTDSAQLAKPATDEGSPRAQGLRAATAGRHQEAIDKLSVALQDNNRDVQARFVLANELAVEGKLHVALVHLNQILQEDPKAPAALTLRGIIRLQQSKFDEAAADLQVAIDRPSPSSQALAYAAMAMLQLGRSEEAETLATKALEKPERFAMVAYQVRGLARLRLKRVDEAAEDLATMERIGSDAEALRILRSAVTAARHASVESPRP